jgi:hypothetical protein
MTGIELIAKERQEQIEKHGRTPEGLKFPNDKHDCVNFFFGIIIVILFGFLLKELPFECVKFNL